MKNLIKIALTVKFRATSFEGEFLARVRLIIAINKKEESATNSRPFCSALGVGQMKKKETNAGSLS